MYIHSPIILTFVWSPVIFCIVVDDPAEVTPTRKPSYSRRENVGLMNISDNRDQLICW